MKQDFLFNMGHGSVNVDWMKAYVNQIKNGTIMNIGVSKQLDDLGSSKKGYMWNPSTCDCECNKACKLINIWILETVPAKETFADTISLITIWLSFFW